MSGLTIRHVQAIRDLLIVQCSVSKSGNQYRISHHDGLIVVRPGGGFSLLLPSQHVEMSRRRIRESIGPVPNRFNSLDIKL